MKCKAPFAVAMLAAASLAPPAKAQVIVDMSLITCGQFLSYDPDRKELVASWMSGYFSASKNLNMLDFRYVKRNSQVINAYCRGHKGETLMSAIQKKAR
jgi:acid stress chaperone HdeB